MRANWLKLLANCLIGALLCATACHSPEKAPKRRELRVFAASSLTEVAGELGRKLEAAEPGVDVVVNLAGSQTLRLQIEQGATVDVFVSASVDDMSALEKVQLMRPSTLLAENELVVAVPTSNPANVQSFADLPRAKRLVVGSKEVPVGKYTEALLERAGETLGPQFRAQVESHIVSREANVRLVLAKVELGEADAAVVYRTDLIAARNVRALPLPTELTERTRYRMAIAVQAPEPELAARWIAFARSPEGRGVLSRAGFLVQP